MKESKDILSMFEALNSHEVFTPPRVAREMLDLLPPEIWSDPSVKILDPCTKSGVFLRECLFRLFDGLEGIGLYEDVSGKTYDLDDKQQRINHIFKNMLFGIATSELTGYVARRTLYGVMKANTDKQNSSLDAFEKSSNFRNWSEEEKSDFIGRNKFNQFFDHKLFCTDDYTGFEVEGNIFYPNDEVRKIIMKEDDYEIEDKYFPFIEENSNHKKIAEIKDGKMKFDVIIGNPPYQVSDSSGRGSAKPIYNIFIEQAIGLKAKFICMITPSRWMLGGKGLDNFRTNILNDDSFKIIRHFDNAKECFPGVEIEGGVSFFLRDSSFHGNCDFNGEERDLSEFEFFVADNTSNKILKKIDGPNFEDRVSPRKPFGLATNFKSFIDKEQLGYIKIYHSAGIGFIKPSDVPIANDNISKPKVFVSRANGGALKSGSIISKPFVPDTHSCCTETFLSISCKDGESPDYICSFLKTKFARFLIRCLKNTQDNPRRVFRLLPDLDFSREWSDSDLYNRYNLDSDEISYIEENIKDMQ